MYQLCYKIHGQKHCFDVPLLVDLVHIHRPGPGPINFPQLELAATVVELVDAIEPGRKSELGEKLVEAVKAFIQDVQAGLPQGVELTEKRAHAKQAA